MEDVIYVVSKVISEEILKPVISGVYIHTFGAGYRMEAPHEHHLVEVISVLHGSSYMIINGQYVKIKKNECLVIFPDVVHDFFLTKDESCRLINVHFNPGDFSSFFNLTHLQGSMRFVYELMTHTTSYFKILDNSVIRNISERILREAEEGSEYSEVLLRLYFCELYIQLSIVLNETGNAFARPVSEYVSTALNYIQSFYNDKITLEQIASYSGISIRHLTRLFLKELNISIQDYVNMLRIRKAKDLLENTELDITEIAFALGFNTSQYFSTCFKKSESITPKTFRQITRDRILNKF